MEQYISKSALVAKIESKKKYAQTLGDNAINSSMQQFYDGMRQGCVDLLSSIDTLEVKEVDLDVERRKYLTEHFNVYEDGILQSKRSNLPLDTYDVIKLAKHFFELWIAVNNKAQKGE